MSDIFIWISFLSKQHTDQPDNQRGDPCDGALPQNHAQGPFPAHLPADGRNGSHAGGIQQAEGQHAGSSQGTEGEETVAEKGVHDGDDAFLGHEAADQGGHNAPVAQAHGGQERRQEAREGGQDAVVGIRDQVQAEVEAFQEPDRDRRNQDYGKGAAQEILGLFPEQLENVPYGRETVVRKLHDEGDGLALEQGLAEQQGDQDPVHCWIPFHSAVLDREIQHAVDRNVDAGSIKIPANQSERLRMSDDDEQISNHGSQQREKEICHLRCDSPIGSASDKATADQGCSYGGYNDCDCISH